MTYEFNYSLNEGHAISLTVSGDLTADDITDLSDWLKLIVRTLERGIREQAERELKEKP